jgi:MFS family permease
VSPLPEPIARPSAGSGTLARSEPGAGVPEPLLASRNFRLFLASIAASSMGDWMLQVAGGLLTVELTSSARVIATVQSVAAIPVAAVLLAAGVWADRFDCRNVLLAVHAALVIASVMATLVVATGHITLPLICVWYFSTGALMAIAAPSRHSLLAELVPAPHMATAVALRGFSYHASGLIGAAIAGAILCVGPLFWIFLANAASYVPAIVVLQLISPACALPLESGRSAPPPSSLVSGVRYACRTPRVRALLGTTLFVSAVVNPFLATFLPLFVRTVLGATERSLVFVVGCCGAGALAGYVALPRLRRALGPELAVCVGMLTCAGALYGASQAGALATAALAAGVLAFGVATTFGLLLTSVQLYVRPDMRGRVMSLCELGLAGVMPLAGIALGVLADRLDLRVTMRMASVAVICVAVLWLIAARTRVDPSDRR